MTPPFICVNHGAQHNTIEDPDEISVKGQHAAGAETPRLQPQLPQVRAISSPASQWRARSPPGSLMGIIRTHPHLRLYVDPVLWTPYHLDLLQVSIFHPETTPPHRPTCPKCNRCGKVTQSVLNLLKSYPYRTEKDRHLTRLVRSTIESFRTVSKAPLFKTSTQHQLPLFFGSKQQCRIVQPLLVQDLFSGAPLLAFTHESSRSDQFDDRFRRHAVTMKPRSLVTTVSDINPHDAAVLIAMAQEERRVQSRSQDQRAVVFTPPTLMTPTPHRDALYIYRATIPLDYLESFTDIHKPLESEMRISRVTIPFDDTAILMETLGQILDLHRRLDTGTHNIIVIEKENGTQKRPIDSEENHGPIKRQRYSKLPRADIAAPNPTSGG